MFNHLIMKKLLSFSFCCIVVLCVACNQMSHFNLATIDPGRFDSTWYNHTPLRFVQTNLSEMDANMDVDVYVQSLADISCN